jgi:hypothetical protein
MADQSWKAFEKLNHRISRLVQGTGATVEWNGEVVDPDTGVRRQIDVLITSADGKRSTVECREHSVAQSVKWIEELIGRKLSLQLDGMIAVSVNGFSAPAAKKAARYGIVLYDFDRLTDQEIASWGGVARVESDFIQFDHLEIVAVIPASDKAILSPADPTFALGTRDGFASVMDLLRDRVGANQNTDLEQNLDPLGFTVDGIPVSFLTAAYRGQLVTQSAPCTYAALIDAPGTARALRAIGVQRFEHSINELVQHNGEAHLQIDVSSIRSPANSILHETRLHFAQPVKVSRYELIGDRRILVVADQVALNVLTTT